MKTAIAFIIVLIAITGAIAQATESATLPAEKPKDVELSVHPAAVPDPALKYQLVPPFEQQTPGNAAQLYLMGFLQLRMDADDRKALDDLLDAPDDHFSVAGAKALVQKKQTALDEIELAARREHCQWDTPLREQGFVGPFPPLLQCRNAARLLSLRARVQIVEGHYDDALHTLQTGFALVAHWKSDALLVQGLVGMGIANLLLDRVSQFEQAPGAPNLYWALTNLPQPLVDLPAMADRERLSPWVTMPELRGRSESQLTDQEWEQIIGKIHTMDAIMSGKMQDGKDVTLAADVALASGIARQWLLSHAYTEKQVKEMSAIKMVGIYYIDSYGEQADEVYKWMPLPYWQQRQGLHNAQDKLRQTHADVELNPLMHVLPNMSRMCLQVAKIDRRLAMLRTVESLRAYAAAHDGKLPMSLSDLTEMPAPIDPMTGRSFNYEVAGTTATLRSTGTKGHEEEETQVYHIKLVE